MPRSHKKNVSKMLDNKCMREPSYPRISQLIPDMCRMALNRDIDQKHSAVVIINGKTVATGVNCMRGARPCHAEAAAVRSLLIARGLLGYVKECRFLRGAQQAKWKKGATQYQAHAIQCRPSSYSQYQISCA